MASTTIKILISLAVMGVVVIPSKVMASTTIHKEYMNPVKKIVVIPSKVMASTTEKDVVKTIKSKSCDTIQSDGFYNSKFFSTLTNALIYLFSLSS